MEDRIPLKLIGITYNQVESGVYALVLQEENGTRRMAIVIGYPEAQAIECHLQDVSTPRPLTHNMFLNLLSGFNIELVEVYIHKLDNGIFAADLVCRGPNGDIITVDSRSSDAISLAIRSGAPIYASEQLLSDAQRPNASRTHERPETNKDTRRSGYAALSADALKKAMEKAVNDENYEKAAEIKHELERRRGMQ